MSDHTRDLGAGSIIGYKLPSWTNDDGVSTIGPLEQATPEKLRLVRKYATELQDSELTRTSPRSFVDGAGREWRIPRSYVDWFQSEPRTWFVQRVASSFRCGLLTRRSASCRSRSVTCVGRRWHERPHRQPRR